jgi:hypothetical protein
MLRRATWLLIVIATLLAIFFGLVRPWYSGWGATADEIRRSLPGDEIVSIAADQTTRAITINAPAENVWPWLAQLGRDRGGFYSYDLLENLVGCEMPTVDELRPERQRWKIGDKLWMYPENKAGGIGFATLRHFGPGRVLGFGTHAFGTRAQDPETGSWTFVLEPIDAATARLIVRGRIAESRPTAWRMFDRLIFEPAHFVMERRMMIGLRQLAEGGSRHRVVNHIQSALWTVTLGLMVAALVLALRQTKWVQALVALAAGAVVFAVLTLGQPSIGIATALVILTAALLPWRKSSHASEAPVWATQGRAL